ncbi:transcriptional regulator, LysR family [Pseudopedobacter saltans DSM 12145]|uniref:Transcriptional regulator, LysR family n=1 Tax=Pseudopedobacter saltans (strain ATCC 51119 / DSM 12145 / JCM 21818 / CCUG 39354 / LMG 10337 / NBRC 100064 / NCIMB 13643) TaxID=762903 RepID=F0S4I3_PSESL|nr:LysR substrate-binding domain-containing protein [Pseudopedobacter saltans]ADY51974.1 transcriptional regulator, LysR family [Pseudopedobacter saltans DSM 12145]
MFDFRLKVFHLVAKRLNFTKAAEELYITQPAVSKHIHEIEVFYGTKLFERNGTRIKLTAAGKILAQYTDQLNHIYRNIESDLAALDKNVKGSLKIGASTTVSQYFLPKQLAIFKQKFPDINIELNSNNTEIIENLLLEGKIDVGIVEGQSKRQNLKYTAIVKDELVLCASTKNDVIKKNTFSLNDLKKIPLLIREPGSGSLEVVSSALKEKGIRFSDLYIEMVLDGIESIKSYLLNSDTFAFLSIHAIYKELKSNELKIIDVKDLNIERNFYFITQQGDSASIKELFLKSLISNNF